ncbi:MAG: apolipoprotein N-acyltransferase [Pirellulales bacterium]|nr:apolipoprotein N-acyltransferase [Pirellulales bacterium]
MRPRLPKSTFWIGLAGAALLWAAMPPLDLWPLAWIAPIPWVWLIRRPRLDGRRPYVALWLAGFCFWMAALHWLRLPHPATSIGWVAISFYFAFYLPAFVGLSRAATHRLHVPVILAAPTVWTGLELVRAHLFTGMTMGSLGYTQHHWIALIQLSDLAGMYGVSFAVMFAAASLARIIPIDGRGWTLWPLLPAAGIVAAALFYGHLRMNSVGADNGPKIALIQGSIDIDMRHDPDRKGNITEQYFNLSLRAVKENPDVDLIVWPETMFLDPLLSYEADARRPAGLECSQEEFFRRLEDASTKGKLAVKRLADALAAPLLLGIDRYHIDADGDKVFNSAVHVARDGAVLDHYDKMHLVMFGEYVPLADRFPWLQGLTPLPLSIAAGRHPAAFELPDGVRLSPNICYETVLPHVIRRQVNQLADVGREPDVLVNLTNDGWFWGSSELDMHLICGVFRAVECRKPLLIAANTGFSAWIDADGRVRSQGPRRKTGIIIARPSLDRQRGSWYLRHGDWFAGTCLACCVLFLIVGLYGRVRSKKPERRP